MRSNCFNCSKPIEGSEFWLSASLYKECKDCQIKSRKENEKQEKFFIISGVIGFLLIIIGVFTPPILIILALIKYIFA